MLEKIENDVPIASRNNESEVPSKKRPSFWVDLQLRFQLERPGIFLVKFSLVKMGFM